MGKKIDKVEFVLDKISEHYPEKAETIATIGFVHWHNILNHAVLEDLDPAQIIWVANQITALAMVHADTILKNDTPEVDSVSFDDMIKFLRGEDAS